MDHLVHAETEHEDVADAREAELREDDDGLCPDRDQDDHEEAIDTARESARLAYLARVRMHRTHRAERLDSRRVGARDGLVLHHAVEPLQRASLTDD